MAAKKKLKHPGAQTGFYEAAIEHAWLPPRQGQPGFSELAEYVLKHDLISNDCETFAHGLRDHKRTALKPHHGDIRLIGLGVGPEKAIILDLGPDGTPNRYGDPLVNSILKAASEKINVGQNFVFDLTYYREKFGLHFSQSLCTKTLSGIRWAGVRHFKHDILSISRRLDLPDYDKSFGALTDFGGNIGDNELQYLYNDILRNLEITDKLIPQIIAQGQIETAVIENAVIPIYADITCNGIPVDEDLLGQFIEQYTRVLRKITGEIKQEARVNPYSSKQVLAFLEEELATTPDPNEEDFGFTVLQSASTDILIAKLVKFPRQLANWCWKVTDARSLRVMLAFAKKISNLIYKGRVHPYFNTFTISGTGRVGNKDPNMAAIAKLRKRFEEMGLMALRKIFRSKDKQLYIFDLPGAHACIAAEASLDPILIEALGSAGGIHAYTSAGMLKLAGYNFTPEYIDKARDDKNDPNFLLCKSTRDNAKPTFYMKLNGGKERRLQEVLRGSDPPIYVPLNEQDPDYRKKDKGKTSKDFSDAWEKTYKVLHQYQQKLCDAANAITETFDGIDYGAVYNLIGRRIYVRKFEEGSVSLPQANMQQWMSTEADWLKRILYYFFYWAKSNKNYEIQIINTQHDEKNSLSVRDPEVCKKICGAMVDIAMTVSRQILPTIMQIPSIEKFVYKSFSKKLMVETLNDK